MPKMLRWFENLPIAAKAFAAPALLLLGLSGFSITTYFTGTKTEAGLEALAQSKLPLWDATERLGNALGDAQLVLFRYVSWLNSGVDATSLKQLKKQLQ
jgi:hypothetical protein